MYEIGNQSYCEQQGDLFEFFIFLSAVNSDAVVDSEENDAQESQ